MSTLRHRRLTSRLVRCLTGGLALAVAACAGGRPSAATRPVPAPPTSSDVLADPAVGGAREIRPGVLHAHLIEGALWVEPSADARAAAGVGELRAELVVCIDATGAVDRQVLVHGSGQADYDRAAGAAIAAWRFRPYEVDGVATPVCSRVWFRDSPRLPASARDALPPSEIELPPSVEVAAAVSADIMQVPATPHVAIVNVCHRPGARDAATVALVQPSGDPATDRALVADPVTALRDEAPGPAPSCEVRSRIAPLDPAAAPLAAEPSGPVVAPKAIDAQRIAGDRRILPSDAIRAEIHRDHRTRLLVPVKLCLDRAGRPVAVILARSSGYLGYDMDLINGVAAWRYRPFMIDGSPVPVCSVVLFVYRQV